MSTLFPYLIALFAVSAYALLGPIAKKIGANLPPFGFIAASSLILFIVCGTLSWFLERQAVSESLAKVHWSWLVIFSLINVVAYVGYLYAIKHIPIVHYEMFVILSPIIAGVVAVLMLNEPFHTRYLLALGFMGVGLFIAIKPQG